MEPEILKRLEAFLEQGTTTSFLRLREAMIASPGYEPYTQTPEAVLTEGSFPDHATAMNTIRQMMGNWFLSPSFHHVLSYLHHKSGDDHLSRVEHELASRFIAGILSTGNGTEENPYLVLHTQDEYDLLDHLDKKRSVQALIFKEPQVALDRLTCEDGTVLWFDVTVPYGRLVQRQNSATEGA